MIGVRFTHFYRCPACGRNHKIKDYLGRTHDCQCGKVGIAAHKWSKKL